MVRIMADKLLLGKSKEDQEDPKMKLINKNPCSLCRAKGLPICKGHGASGAVGSASTQATPITIPAMTTCTPTDLVATAAKLVMQKSSRDTVTYYQEIASTKKQDDEQVDDDLIVLVNELELGIMTLRIKLGLTYKEEEKVRQLMFNIKMAFKDYKKQLEKHGVNVEGMHCRLNRTGMEIRIPTPKQYDIFLHLLVIKKYLTVLQLQMHHTITTPTPFVTRPSPAITPYKKTQEQLNREEMYPNPFRMSLKLRNLPC